MRRSISAAALLATFVLAASTSTARQGGVTRFCTSGASGATIFVAGSADLNANGGSGDLVLHGEGLPASTLAIFLLGNAATPGIPLGNGVLCAGGASQVWRLGTASTSATGSSVERAVDYLSAPDPAAQITPGSTWNFQVWFRDGASADLTDALAIQFVPPLPIAFTPIYTSGGTHHPLGQSVGPGGAVVLDDPAAFQAFWSQHTSTSPAPQIDLTQFTAIAVFAGLRLSSGYRIEVTDVSLSVTSVHVTSLETGPGLGCGVVHHSMSPMQLVIVPKIGGATLGSWIAGHATYSCP